MPRVADIKENMGSSKTCVGKRGRGGGRRKEREKGCELIKLFDLERCRDSATSFVAPIPTGNGTE